jgi:anti-anti-sigma regulatory factor
MRTRYDEETCTIVEIPAYLTQWDIEEWVGKTLFTLKTPGIPCIIDMARVRNVFSATVHLIMRIYEKAGRMGSEVYIINACETVRNALESLELDKKIPVYPDHLTIMLELGQPVMSFCN